MNQSHWELSRQPEQQRKAHIDSQSPVFEIDWMLQQKLCIKVMSWLSEINLEF